jgi:hypothetical protein
LDRQASPRGRGDSRAGKPEPAERKAGEAIHSQAIARVNQSIGTARGAGSPITSSEAQQASLALPMGGGPRWESHQLQTQEGAGSSPRSMQGYPASLGSRNPTVCSKPVSLGLLPISGRRPRETDGRARTWRAERFGVNAMASRPQLKSRARVLQRAYGVLRHGVACVAVSRGGPAELLGRGAGRRSRACS